MSASDETPRFEGGYLFGQYIPPGLMEFSHYWRGCPVFVPKDLPPLEPHPTPFADLFANERRGRQA